MLFGVHKFPKILIVKVGHSSFPICLHKYKFIFLSILSQYSKNVLFLLISFFTFFERMQFDVINKSLICKLRPYRPIDINLLP